MRRITSSPSTSDSNAWASPCLSPETSPSLPIDTKRVSFDWIPIRYRNVISLLKNPFYAGAYCYGKSEVQTEIVDGHVRKSYGRRKSSGWWGRLAHEIALELQVPAR